MGSPRSRLAWLAGLLTSVVAGACGDGESPPGVTAAGGTGVDGNGGAGGGGDDAGSTAEGDAGLFSFATLGSRRWVRRVRAGITSGAAITHGAAWIGGLIAEVASGDPLSSIGVAWLSW